MSGLLIERRAADRDVGHIYALNDVEVHWIYAPGVRYEDEVARRWWSLSLNSLLPLSDGRQYQLLFPGRPGGSAGPDIRDAVLVSSAGKKLVGDVEFHVRSSNWRTHGHQRDPRYNAVILHVVLICDDTQPTLRQDGSAVPVCSLYDLPQSGPESELQPLFHAVSDTEARWPCQRLMRTLLPEQRDKLLWRAGLLRFEQKMHAFVEQLHAGQTDSVDETQAYDCYDACLIPALAEGLGYGRDRAFFRAVGQRLIQRLAPLPEPLGHSEQPAPLDASRLRILALLLSRWRTPVPGSGLWHTLRTALLSPSPTPPSLTPSSHAAPILTLAAPLDALRRLFTQVGLSLARTDILIVNIVLPFAAAVALLEHQPLLGERAHQLYLQHPGLPSNSITRSMCTQLQLSTPPQGSCRQQGLHYIYQQTCREKRCNICIISKQDI